MKVKISLEQFRKNFKNNFPEFVLRIRKTSKDLAYYNGNKAFEIKKDNDIIDINFPVNTIKVNTTSVSEHLSLKEEKDVLNNYLTNLVKTCEALNKFYDFTLEKMEYKIIDENANKILAKKFEQLKNDIYNINPEIKIYCDKDKTKTTIIVKGCNTIKEMIEVQYKFFANMKMDNSKIERKYIKDCKTFFMVKDKQDKTYELKEIIDHNNSNSFVNCIKNAIEHYVGKDEIEKRYQHQFMLHGSELKSLFKDKIVYPFEQEYVIDGHEKKGRVDTVFYAFNAKKQLSDIYLIEIKVNSDVIGGTNGIMTHLDDIRHFFSDHSQPDNVKNIIKYRHDTLYDTNMEFADKINYHFYTVIGFTMKKAFVDGTIKEREIVKTFINNLNSEKKAKNAMIKHNVDKSFYDHTIKTISPSPDICEVKFFYEVNDWIIDTVISDNFKEYILNNNELIN